MIMGKLDLRTIYIIFASAFLVNPVLLQNNTTTISTSLSSSSQVPPSITTNTITTTIVTAPDPDPTTTIQVPAPTTTIQVSEPTTTNPNTATPMATSPPTTPKPTNAPTTTSSTTTPQPTTTTTTAPMTTAVPIGIGGNCSSSPGSCESSDSNSTCIEDKCRCKDGFFILVNTCEPPPSPPDCPKYRNRNTYNAPNITITWNQTKGDVQAYGVQFESEMDFNVTNPNASFNFVDPGRNYTITLITYAHNRTSKEGKCVIRTESQVPDPPKNVTIADTVGKDNFNISIIAPDEPRGDIIGYRIKICGKNYEAENFSCRMPVLITDTMDNIYHVTGLQAGTFYNIQVYTVNDKFNSSDSLNLTGLRTAQDVPDKITNYTGTSSKDSFQVMFQRPIKPNGDITGYRILVTHSGPPIVCKEYHLQNVNFSPKDKCSSPAINSSITLNQKEMELNVTDLEPSIDYIVNIWAYTSVGEGRPFTVTVMTGISAPYKPTNVKAQANQQNSVLVTWNKPEKRTGKTSYLVEAFDYLNGGRNVNETCRKEGFNETSCKVEGLEDFWRYTFQVTAQVEDWKNKSDVTPVITTLEGKPGQPEEFGTPLENKGCKVTLSWSTPKLKDRNANITMYKIQIDLAKEYYKVKKSEPYNPKKTQFSKTYTLEKERDINIKISSMSSGNVESMAVAKVVKTFECYDPLTGGEIAGIIFCVLLLLAVIGIIGFMVHRNWERVKEYLPNFGGRQPSGEFEPLQPPPERYRPIVLSAIRDFLRKYHADDNRLFIGEYEDLKQLSPRHTTNSANLDENKPKNRYTNILPYDHSRVILAPMVDEEDSSDYINANYIPGYTYGKEFIASQGPLPGTANDFWRMIWEQSVSIIVMLTKCSENNMDKCEHYWPHAANEPKCYNDLMVNVTSVSNMGKYDIHIMDVCLGDEKRVVKHFHFLEWPDFSAKVETTTLIEFITTVRQHITPDIKGPTVTHCSAGVGRTGTFITVDYLMQYVEDHDLSSQVDIFDWVIQMRDHRTTMVQTWAQYAFIHDCLSEIVERKKKLQNPEENGEVCIDNLAYEPDDLYENTKLGPLQTEL